MAYFDELMQRAITVRNNVAPSSNTALLVGGVLVSIVSALQLLLDTKQGTLTFDNEPTDGSTNPVTSDGIYEAIADAIASIDLSACEKIVNKVTTIDDQSTDVQYPTAKLLYDSLQALANEYAAIYHTHHYTDIEHPAIAATAGALGYTIDTTEYSHIITLTADTTLHLPTITAGTARIMRLTLIQDLTGGHGVTFDGGNAMVYNPYQVDLSQGLGGYRCWVTLWFDGAQWCYIATPYVLRSESQFDYTISGTSTGASVTITINGSTMNIPVNAGAWEYGYNGAVTSLSLAGDTGVTTIDFSLSDGLAGVTSLAGAFSGCSALQSIDFTDCDLSAIVDATNAFSGCSALTALTIPSGEWLPDLDLSATAIGYSAMADVIIGLHTYASGTHTVTFNATIWDALTQAQQQTISDAASAKGWTTNTVAVVYAIRGTSTNVGGSETFAIQFIQDGSQTPDAAETITCAVDSSGNWEYLYNGKKIYSLAAFARNNSTLLSIDMTDADECEQCASSYNMFGGCANLSAINLSAQKFTNATNIGMMFYNVPKLQTLSLPNATFANATDAESFCQQASSALLETISMPNATFASLTTAKAMFYNCQKVTTISMPNATFASLQNANNMFRAMKQLTSLSLPQTFANLTNAETMFYDCDHLQNLDLSSATFASLTTVRQMFFGMKALTAIDLSSATFASVTDGYGMFNQYGNHPLQTLSLPNATFANVTNAFAMFLADGLRTLNIPNATFASVTSTSYMLSDLKNLTTINVPQGTFPITFGFTRSNSGIALTYQSMVNVANWCKDLTGGTAQTLTLNTSAWNALTAAEQATIQGILQAKNWNLATA